jgi:hypothetical protein
MYLKREAFIVLKIVKKALKFPKISISPFWLKPPIFKNFQPNFLASFKGLSIPIQHFNP